MTTWTCIKQSDSRKDNQYKMASGTVTGVCPSKIVTFALPTTLSKVGHKQRGAMTAFLGMKTKDFRPNRFRITPAVHRSASYECSDTSVELLENLCYGRPNQVTRKIQGPLALLPNVPVQPAYAYPSYSYDVDESLVQKAFARSNEAQAAVLTSAVELPETLRMFISPFNRLGSALDGLSNPRTLRKITKNVKMKKRQDFAGVGYAAEAWLTLRYGILPVMAEIDTYRRLYDSKLNTKLGPIIKARAGSGEASSGTLYNFSAVTSWAGLYFWGTQRVYSYDKKSITVYSQRQWDIQSSLGLDLNGLVGAIYEKIPYSFVLDWFINFGDWWQGIMPVSGVTQLGHVVSTKRIYDVVTTVNQMALGNKMPRSDVSSVATFKSFTYNRWTDHVPQLLPAASPYLGNIVRMIDAVGLAFGKAKNKLPYR